MGQYHWEPDSYLALMRSEVADYERLQDELAAATTGVDAAAVLDLGTGTGETARRVLDRHPDARLTGIDESEGMLAAARTALAGRPVELRTGRLEDALPPGPFDLAVSALAVHHLDDAGQGRPVRPRGRRAAPRRPLRARRRRRARTIPPTPSSPCRPTTTSRARSPTSSSGCARPASSPPSPGAIAISP